MLAGGVTLALGGAVATNFLMARSQEQFSDLTLADIELFASPCQENIEFNGPIITVTVCDRTTSIWQAAITGVWCGTDSDGSCSFNNVK